MTHLYATASILLQNHTIMNITALIVYFTISFVIAVLWVRGIDKMKREHPDYKGEDFLNHDDKNTSS